MVSVVTAKVGREVNSNFFHEGGMDVCWNDPYCRKYVADE
jgi:hypothetical protein